MILRESLIRIIKCEAYRGGVYFTRKFKEFTYVSNLTFQRVPFKE